MWLPALILLYARFLSAGFGRRDSLLRAAVVAGTATALSTEVLSLFRQVRFWPLTFFWGLLALACMPGLSTRKTLASLRANIDRRALLWAPPFAFTLLCTLVTALLAAPNTYDSMTYHMSRVTHWIQNHSVAHYPSGIDRQLCHSPFAEYAILHSQVLALGSDRFANLIQWLAFVGSITGISLILKALGQPRQTQWLGGLLVASLPMALMEATSTQNDLVCGVWITSFVYFTLLAPSLPNVLLASLALGLAILTKTTAVLFAPPLAAWWFYRLARARNVPALVRALLLSGCAVLLLNAGYLARNQATYGYVAGPRQYSSDMRMHTRAPRAVLSNVVKNFAMAFTWPDQDWTDRTVETVRTFHLLLGIDPSDPASSISEFNILPLWNHEDYAGNGMLVLLALLYLPHLLARQRLKTGAPPIPRLFLLAILAGFVLFSAILKWQLWSTRLQTPFFILLSAPLAAVLGAELQTAPRKRTLLVGYGIFVLSLPWVLMDRSRPLISRASYGADSVLTSARLDQYFVNGSERREDYKALIDRLAHLECDRVGLRTGGDSWEYPLHRLASARGLNIRWEHVFVSNPSAALLDPAFVPCAVIALDQQESWSPPELRGLGFRKAWSVEGLALFIARER